jgi:low temperature requirement protein LtrA
MTSSQLEVKGYFADRSGYVAAAMLRDFRRRFWQPPRAHGDVVEDRTVSFLELFHDLVYVVVIAAAASTVAHDVTLRTAAEFAVVFGLIWLAWINGTFLHDLHGRTDIRTRFYTFAQMLLIVLLAVYVADATGDGGQGFALVYTAYLVLLTWLWYAVRRQDDERFMDITRQYLTRMVLSVVAMAVSAFLPTEWRMIVWALIVVMWLATVIRLGGSEEIVGDEGGFVSDSLVERFGLFVIIVLGEVIVGVVDGLSNTERDPETVATAMFGLIIGFGLWWVSFDLTGRRRPRADPGGGPIWIASQLPLTLSIAAAGAAMVGLIQHATDDRAPAATTWLLAGSVALGLVSLAVIVRTLRDYDRLSTVYRPTSILMLGAAGVALLIGAWRPAPLVLVIAPGAIYFVVWVFAVSRWLATDEAAQRTD